MSFSEEATGVGVGGQNRVRVTFIIRDDVYYYSLLP